MLEQVLTGNTPMKNVIFDFGGVLLEWSPDHFYLDYFNYDFDLMKRFFDQTNIKTINVSLDRGESFDQVLSELAQAHPEFKHAITAWKTDWNKMLVAQIDGSVDILKRLHKNSYKLFGLSNWSSETFPFAYYTYDFFRLFDNIVLSGAEKYIKPELEIYKICLNRNNLDPFETIFIDDVKANVDAATILGITGIKFENPQQLEKELKQLGLEF